MKPTTIIALAFVVPAFAQPITITDSPDSGNQRRLVERDQQEQQPEQQQPENNHKTTLHTVATVGRKAVKVGLKAAGIGFKAAKVGLKVAEFLPILARGVGKRALFDRGYEISARRPLPRRFIEDDFDRRDLDELADRNFDGNRDGDKLDARRIDDGLETRHFDDDLEGRDFDDGFLDARALD